ncbi:MAG: hypothetical protein RSB76_01085 [Clostridia bacterium]
MFEEQDKTLNIGTQKIECSVVECQHNCIETSTCKLNIIRVCPKGSNIQDDNGSFCSSYHYIGNQNVVGITGVD